MCSSDTRSQLQREVLCCPRNRMKKSTLNQGQRLPCAMGGCPRDHPQGPAQGRPRIRVGHPSQVPWPPCSNSWACAKALDPSISSVASARASPTCCGTAWRTPHAARAGHPQVVGHRFHQIRRSKGSEICHMFWILFWWIGMDWLDRCEEKPHCC